jgi:hypothetical protein
MRIQNPFKKTHADLNHLFSLITFILALIAPAAAFAGSPIANPPPVIDGVISAGEWSNAHSIDIPTGAVMVMHDDKKIYVLIDVVSDTGDNEAPGDLYEFTIDTNSDGLLTPNVDVQFGILNSGEICWARLLGETSSDGCNATASLLSRGFGASPASDTEHRFWELAIDRDESGLNGDVLNFGVRTYSQTPFFDDSFPESYMSDFSLMLSVDLAFTIDTSSMAPITGLWWNKDESGWGVNLIQQFNITFVTLFTYGTDGLPRWYVASSCAISGAGCTGILYEVTAGSPILQEWIGTVDASSVGTVTFNFSNNNTGEMVIEINGETNTKMIERQIWRTSAGSQSP